MATTATAVAAVLSGCTCLEPVRESTAVAKPRPAPETMIYPSLVNPNYYFRNRTGPNKP